MAERIPPHSDDAERSVLGAALQSKQALYDAMETLDTEDFYRDAHAKIFDAMRQLHKASEAVDIVTVSDTLTKRKQLSAAGGRAYLAELAGVVPSTLNAEQYAKIIIEKAKLRKLIEKSADIIAMSYDNKEKADDILSRAENEILDIAQSSQNHDVVTVGDAITQSLQRIKDHKASGKKLLGLNTGFRHLNNITSGFQKQDLIIVAARPGMGKTSLALNFALNAAKHEKATVMIFSLEMGEQALAQRLLSVLGNVEMKKIRDGSVYDNVGETEKLTEAAEKLSEMNILIDSSSGISINEMKNKCRRQIQRYGAVDLVIVDYLQLMSLTGSDRPDNRTLEIAAITRMLKLMAKELDCPVMVLSQTSRDYEKRKGQPMLSDLRDSGAIEQDADLIMFIHNKSEKEIKEEDDENYEQEYDPDTMRMLLILKHRNGETGKLTLSWIDKYTKFGEPAFSSLPYEDYGGTVSGYEDYQGSEGDTESRPTTNLPF